MVVMIYYIALLDKDYKEIWHYLNPRIPLQLSNRLNTIGFDSLVSMLSAFSMLGAELFREPLTSIEYNTFQITYYRIRLDKDDKILGVIMTDRNEDLGKLKRMIEKVVEMNYNLIKKRSSGAIDEETHSNEPEVILESFKLLQEKSRISSIKRFAYKYRTSIVSSITTLVLVIAAFTIYMNGFSFMTITLAFGLIASIQALNILIKKSFRRSKYYRLVS